MPASIGVNLRVTGHCSQGGRKYMEDFFSVAYQQTEDEKDLEYAFFGIYDGHGGGEAATYAKEHLMESIVRQKSFWSDKDDEVLRAIKEGYIATHYAMWKEQVNWPKTASGLPSTAGTTATIAFIRHAKIYIGHVGDSGVILGYQEPGEMQWKARPLTKDHKPENAAEMFRIQQCGGKVVTKSGVPRVVWNRPRIGHKGPVRRSTPIDEIPFLAVARSLGDLWSYNSACDQFVVSPDPDTCVIPIDTNTFRCLIFGTDGLWNMMTPETAVQIVQTTEKHNECIVFTPNIKQKIWINPSKSLVEHSLERWSTTRMRADNTTAVTLLLDPPGPPRAEVLKNQHKESMEANNRQLTSDMNPVTDDTNIENNTYPANGLAIVTRYPVDQFLYPENEPIDNNITPCQNYCPKNDSLPSSSGLSNIETHVVEETPIKSSQAIHEELQTPVNQVESENIQINEVSSSSPEENPPLTTSTDEIVDDCKKQTVKLVKSRTNIVSTRRCTRSNDTLIDRRVKTVSSSSDYCLKDENRKKVKIFCSNPRKDDLRRNTRAMEKNAALNFERRVTRKRNVINNTSVTERKVMTTSSIVLKERFSPPSKKVRQFGSYTSTCLSSRKSIGSTNDLDFENSDQENQSRQKNLTRSKSFVQTKSFDNDSSNRVRLRTRQSTDYTRNVAETPVPSCSYTCVVRNLRERNTNLTPQNNAKHPTHHHNIITNNNNASLPRKCLGKRFIPTKNKVQTRNRVKKCTK